MASLAAQMLFNKAPVQDNTTSVQGGADVKVINASEEEVTPDMLKAIVKVIQCQDGELPLGAKAVEYIEKNNLPVAFMPIATVQQVLLAAAMQEANLSEAAGVEEKKKKKRAKKKQVPAVYPEVGDRVRHQEGYYGSVRYVGVVCTAKNPYFNYVGVEWDEAGRGIHDGAVKVEQGYERYFDCEMGKGSFVKPEKLQLPVEFLAAMKERYEHGGDSEEVINAVDTLRGKTKPITLVGMDKVAAWHKLDTIFQVSLENFNVGKAGPAGVLREACPRIQELNLRKTMFGNWDDLAKLGHELTRLKNLQLPANRFVKLPYPLPTSHPLRGSFPSLRVLVLTDTNVSWGEVAAIDEAIPNLEELHLAKNGLSSFDLPMTTYAEWSVNQGDRTRDARGAAGKPLVGFKKLKMLNLSENLFDDWRQIWRLGWLPALEYLILNENQLESIEYLGEEFLRQKGAKAAAYRVVYDEDVVQDASGKSENASKSSNMGSKPQDFQDYILKQKSEAKVYDHSQQMTEGAFEGTPFKCLRNISLDHNKVSSWATFDALNEFVSLETVRFQHNPLSDSNSGNIMRQTAIARVAQMKLYNGSEVRPLERADSERLYLKRVLLEHQNEDKTETVANIVEKVKEEHPRLAQLLEIHGEPLMKKSGAAAGTGSGFASSMIKVALLSNVPASCTVPVKQIKVPESMTVATLKLLCQRRFKMDASEQMLFYRDNATCGHPLSLDDDAKDIGYYGVKDGGEIIMEELSEQQQMSNAREGLDEATYKKAEEDAAAILAAKREIVNSAKDAAAKAADAVPFVSKFR